MRIKTSKKHMNGETRSKKPMPAGLSQTFPLGWVMELSAMGTSPQNADCQDT